MATEILVNDGGAPARILPFTAGSAITGGRFVSMGTDGEVDHAGADAHNTLGVALVDAAAGDVVSVVTGRGVICNVWLSGTVDEGLLVDITADGVAHSGGTDTAIAASGTAVGITLTGAAFGSTITLGKCLLRN